jgi:Zn-dependent peptidase ImmA (M78 family)/transcriptional regulator with XRE-family HTH domain
MPTAPQNQNLLIGSAIRAARESLEWNQLRLAESVGFASAQIISSIENGQRELKASELLRIAKSLRISVETLLRGEQPIANQVQWRERDPNAGKEIESKFVERARRYARLEEWCQCTVTKVPGTLQLESGCSFERVKNEADNIRLYMKLGGRPALSLAKTLEEDYGVKIFYDSLGETGAGMSARGDFGCAVLLNVDQAPWRRNFSLGHELFHLLSPDELSAESPDRLEQLANCFSSNVLLPPEAIYDFIKLKAAGGKIAYRDIVELAREFCVSSEAVIWRLVGLGTMKKEEAQRLLNDDVFRAIDKASFPRWDRPSPLPERYRRLAVLAYERGKLGVARLAEFLESNIIDVAEETSALEVNIAEHDTAQVSLA